MRCSNCGAENSNTAKFCAKCGSPLIPQNALPEEQKTQKKEEKPKRKKRKWGIILAVVVILAAVLVAVLYSTGNKEEKKEGPGYEDMITDAEKYLEDMDYEKAEDCYLKAIEIDPKQIEPYLQLSDIYVIQEEYEKAKTILEDAKNAVTSNDGEDKGKNTDDIKQQLEDKLEEISKLEKYTWAVEPTIEADDIFYLRENEKNVLYCNGLNRQFESSYAIVRRGDMFGVIDMSGKMIANTEYYEIWGQGEDYTLDQCIGDSWNSGWQDMNEYKLTMSGEMDENDTWGASQELYDNITGIFYWHDGLSYATVVELNEGSADISSDAIPIKKSEKLEYPDNLMMAEQEAPIKWWGELPGLYAICKNGQLVTEFEYDECGSAADGLLAVCKNGKWGYINEEGQVVIPLEYDATWEQFIPGENYYSNAVALAEDADSDGIMGGMTKEKILSSRKNVTKDYCYAASDGYVVLRKGNKWEIRDTAGKLVLRSGLFEAIRPIYNGKCWVKKDGRWGVIELGNQAGNSDEDPHKR